MRRPPGATIPPRALPVLLRRLDLKLAPSRGLGARAHTHTDAHLNGVLRVSGQKLAARWDWRWPKLGDGPADSAQLAVPLSKLNANERNAPPSGQRATQLEVITAPTRLLVGATLRAATSGAETSRSAGLATNYLIERPPRRAAPVSLAAAGAATMINCGHDHLDKRRSAATASGPLIQFKLLRD